MPKSLPDKKVFKVFDGIEVSTRLYNALAKYGLMTWQQVASLSEFDVRCMNGVGKNVLMEIHDCLNSLGLVPNFSPTKKRKWICSQCRKYDCGVHVKEYY